MADVEGLYSEFVAEHKAGGEADPKQFLQQLEGRERRALATLIDGYLSRSPGREWDAAAFEGSPAQAWAERMAAELAGEPVTAGWSKVLPELREKARITRRKLVEQLADAIGAPDQTEKVSLYYHRMERGELEPGGVSTRVLEALAGIVGSSTDALRQAGQGFATETMEEKAVFARTSAPDPEYIGERLASGPAEAAAAPADERSDLVDRLFTGGD